MERKRHKPEQIVAILREAERGGTTADVCRKYGISEQTFYRWKRMYGGLGLNEVQKAKRLEKENHQLKRLVGEQALVIQTFKEEVEKKGWSGG